MRRLAWTFAARIGDKYQIRLTRSICVIYRHVTHCSLHVSNIFFKHRNPGAVYWGSPVVSALASSAGDHWFNPSSCRPEKNCWPNTLLCHKFEDIKKCAVQDAIWRPPVQGESPSVLVKVYMFACRLSSCKTGITPTHNAQQWGWQYLLKERKHFFAPPYNWLGSKWVK